MTAIISILLRSLAKKQATLANGIAGSLTPTALGLMISMLGLAANHFTKSVAVNLTERIHYGVTVLHNLLVPQDVTIQTVSGIGAGMIPQMMSPEGLDVTDVVEEEKEDNDDEDTFDDAAIDDIKDEEEII